MLDKSEVGKRGYLTENYRLFYLKDNRAVQLDYHYHEFDKIVLQISGRVTYNIEGKSYLLQPMDLLLISRNLIHLPVIDTSEVYERMVLWIHRDFLSRYSTEQSNLAVCFEETVKRQFHLYRPQGENRSRYRTLFEAILKAQQNQFAPQILSDTCVLQLMISLCEDILSHQTPVEATSYRFDPKMEEVTQFIRSHLGEELTIERLSSSFYLSRYHLMHRFKEIYGCTIQQYIRQKRLQYAAEQIRQGVPILKAAEDSGFGDYSVFLRAFRTAYGKSPREWK
ncbi:MAG: helix-turn-helix domain-containing protein [Oscillospiraceae bacterium]|nr:helix-turn-helix domain-containing protein [Oscillospiraceae bacterium]